MTKQYSLLIDLDRCTGCHTCSVACKLENGLPVGIQRMRVLTVGGGGMDIPVGEYPNLKLVYLPKACMQCEDAPCVDSCPTDALYYREDRTVGLDKEKCNGCEACLTACPYGAIEENQSTGIVEKCDLCSHRIEAGLDPFCVICCPARAIYFGSPEELTERALGKRGVSEEMLLRLLEDRGTRPMVRYLSRDTKLLTLIDGELSK